MIKAGENHRTIYPAICQMGYTGSSNAIYQYMLKLRKEEPDSLHPELVDMPSELKLESHSRDKLYTEILKEAAKSRPGYEESSRKRASSKVNGRPAEASRSPFSAKATELILGPEIEANEQKENPKKKASSYRKQ
jgi:hypothetical protein